jgi:hypothetical protein
MYEVHKDNGPTDSTVAHSERVIYRCSQQNATKELNHRKTSSISHIAK